MQQVTVNKQDLLEAVTKNRANHRKIFLLAFAGYREKIIEALEYKLKNIKNGKKIELFFSLPEPKDQTKDYDRIVRMLELSIDDEIELSQDEFARYVMDDWYWREEFLNTSANYTRIKS